MVMQNGKRGDCRFLYISNSQLVTRPLQEVHVHQPPYPARVLKGDDLPICFVLDTGTSSRGKNVLHIYYGSERQQHEVSEELLRRGRQLWWVMWVVGTIVLLDILRRL
jgi:hypothetical protein